MCFRAETIMLKSMAKQTSTLQGGKWHGCQRHCEQESRSNLLQVKLSNLAVQDSGTGTFSTSLIFPCVELAPTSFDGGHGKCAVGSGQASNLMSFPLASSI